MPDQMTFNNRQFPFPAKNRGEVVRVAATQINRGHTTTQNVFISYLITPTPTKKQTETISWNLIHN